MKKFFANVIIVISIIVGALVAVPIPALKEFNLGWSFLDINLATEVLYKGIAGGVLIFFSLIYLIVAIVEQAHNGQIEKSTGYAVIVPMFMFSLGAMLFATIVGVFTLLYFPEGLFPLEILIGLGVLLINLIFIGHLVSVNFREGKTFRRIFLFIGLIEMMAIPGGIAWYLATYNFPLYATAISTNYYYLYLGIPVLALLGYVLHIVLMAAKAKRQMDFAELGGSIPVAKAAKPAEESSSEPQETPVAKSEMVTEKPVPAKPEKLSKKELALQKQEEMQAAKGKKSVIVSKEQSILSGEMNVDPTDLLYEEVTVDPEFNKTSNMDKQVSSIEYYIEKPKMFRPLDPTFDSLVSYVRELPNVVTKISDERISFYVDRKAFLVLMNFGNYYRMAFRSDLEKGVRLIIKYPTISKNKGTKDALWFKANNYGDLPKEVIYEIVKSAFDNVNA